MLIVCILILQYLYLPVTIYETFYLLWGERVTVTIIDISEIKDEYVYTCSVNTSEATHTLKTLRTSKELELFQVVKGSKVPHFNMFLFGEFALFPYIFSLIFHLFLLFVAFISICMLLEINNYFTKRIKKQS